MFWWLCGTRLIHLVCTSRLLISIYVGSIFWTFIHVWLIYQYGIWEGNLNSKPLYKNYIFLYFGLIHTAWGHKIEPQCFHFIFPQNFTLQISFIGTQRIWNRSPTTSFYFYFLLFSFSPFGRGGVGSNPHIPTLFFFSLIFLGSA